MLSFLKIEQFIYATNHVYKKKKVVIKGVINVVDICKSP